jgi:hypothetical protein
VLLGDDLHTVAEYCDGSPRLIRLAGPGQLPDGQDIQIGAQCVGDGRCDQDTTGADSEYGNILTGILQ